MRLMTERVGVLLSILGVLVFSGSIMYADNSIDTEIKKSYSKTVAGWSSSRVETVTTSYSEVSAGWSNKGEIISKRNYSKKAAEWSNGGNEKITNSYAEISANWSNKNREKVKKI